MKNLTCLFCFFSLCLSLSSGALFADFDHSDDDNLLYDRERRDDKQRMWQEGVNPYNNSGQYYRGRNSRYNPNRDDTYYYYDDSN